jgi:ABC-2 type transport system permease protein
MVEVRKDTAGLIGLPYKLNLEDLLFKYGIRINEDLIKDLYGAPVPVKVSNQYKLMPWGFNPIFSNFNNKHPITHNMGDIYGKNVGTMDTTFAKDIKKTPLVFSSPYVLKHGQPVIFSPEELRYQPQKEAYPTGNLAVAYLLEGGFQSLYKSRPLPEGANTNSFIEKGQNCQIIVVSDGDIIANAIDQQTQQPYELGFDIITKQQYANRDFALNCINYLLDEDGIIDLKLNAYKPRPLDKFKVKNDKTYWQTINVAVPIAVVLLFASVQFYWRKKKNTNN